MNSTINNQVFIFNQDVDWEEVGPGVKRKIMAYDERLMLVRVAFQEGGVGPIHQHYHSQVTHVERGAFEVCIGEEKKILKAGDVFYIPPNVPHGAIALEDGVLIDVFSPMREDFLD